MIRFDLVAVLGIECMRNVVGQQEGLANGLAGQRLARQLVDDAAKRRAFSAGKGRRTDFLVVEQGQYTTVEGA